MILRYGGPCRKCGEKIPQGTEAKYNADSKTVEHWTCPRDEQETSGESPEQLAARLGFGNHRECGLDSDGILLCVSPWVGKPASEPERSEDAPRGLFDSVPGVPEEEIA